MCNTGENISLIILNIHKGRQLPRIVDTSEFSYNKLVFINNALIFFEGSNSKALSRKVSVL